MNKNIISQDLIEGKILLIRNLKVMLDKDLAQLYKVETRSLKQAVKRKYKKISARFYVYIKKK